jgi:O-antigen/teichoic acid export membrane protein
MRTILVVVGYGILFLLIYYLFPYQEETKTVILILGLAVLPEALFALFQALFVAHERLMFPTIAAVFNSGFKLGVGYWLLANGYPVTTIVWVMPVGSALSLLFLLPGLVQLFRLIPQVLPSRLNFSFSLGQLHYMPGFVLISTFLTLDFQLDAFLISLYLSETDIGWYGAAQTIVLGFWMMATAIRTTLYPVMARIQKETPERLPNLYRRAHQYLLLAALPIAAGITVLARPIVRLVFGEGFEETVPALQIMIWAVVFAFVNVPNARLVLVRNRQKQAGWMTGISLVVNVVLNLLLIPRLGIFGAAAARTLATAVLFLQLYFYSQRYLEV